MACWVGGYIEEGMSAKAGTPTPYLTFAFCGPATAAEAKAQAGAKLLAGPFNTQGDAQAWANSYNKNPHTPRAGNDLSPSGSISTNDQPPGPLSGINEVGSVLGSVYRQVTKVSIWRSLGWLALGGLLVIVALIWMGRGEITKTVKGLF